MNLPARRPSTDIAGSIAFLATGALTVAAAAGAVVLFFAVVGAVTFLPAYFGAWALCWLFPALPFTWQTVVALWVILAVFGGRSSS